MGGQRPHRRNQGTRAHLSSCEPRLEARALAADTHHHYALAAQQPLKGHAARGKRASYRATSS